VAEVPGERAEDRGIDPIQLTLVERLDQRERTLASFGEPVDDPLLDAGVGGDRDGDRLPTGAGDPSAAADEFKRG
jgi:hypothetical protein